MKYTTDTQVREAIVRWRGNVTAAADELGIQPKNLRKRLDALRIDLLALRASRGAMGAGPLAPHGPSGLLGPAQTLVGPMAPSIGTGRKNAAGLSPREGAMPILRDVSTTAAAVGAVGEPDAPVKGVTVRPKPLRLEPTHQDRLRNAKLDLGAKYRIETDENTILNQFFEEAFEPWLRSKLGPAPAPPRRSGKRTTEKGEAE